MTAAMCTVLAAALARAPAAALRMRLRAVVTLLADVLAASADAPSVLRAALPCVGHLLRCATEEPAAAWPPCARAFGALLAHATDARPKVRHAAVSAAEQALQALRGSPAGAQASEAVARWSHGALTLPTSAAASLAAARRPSDVRAAEEGAAGTLTPALHAMGALKALLPALSSRAAAATVAEDLLALLHLEQPLLQQHALDALAALLSAEHCALPPPALVALVKALDDIPLASLPPAAAVALCRALCAGYAALHAADAAACARTLPGAFHSLARVLRSAPTGGVAAEAAQALKHLIRSCVDAPMVAEAIRAAAAAAQAGGGAAAARANRAAPTPLSSIVAAVESMLGYRYREAWPAVLPVLAVLFERLGPAAGALLPGALSALAEMATATELSCRPALLATLGAALRSAGPERVLAVLPLQLDAALDASLAAARTARPMDEGEDGEEDPEEARQAGHAWLLPLLAQHATGARLGFFTAALLPAAKALAARAAAARAAGREFEAARASALEAGVWATLPSFATWPEDVAAAFPSLARELGAHLTSRPDLHTPILGALRALLTLLPAAAAGGAAAAEAGAPPSLAPEAAAAGLTAVGAYAKNFLPILFNAFVAAPPERRGDLGATVGAFAAAADAASVGSFFRVVLKKLIAVTGQAEDTPGALLEGGDTRAARRATFLELLLALAPGLGEPELELLLRAALPVLGERDAGLQKRGYKLCAWLAAERDAWLAPRMPQLLAALMEAAPVCVPAARHHRLRLLGVLLPGLRIGEPGQAPHAPELLAELILGTKETNGKTRAAAFELLVQLARRLEEGAAADGRPGEGVRRLFGLVLGGFAGASPAMVSASVMAASRLVYEFSGPLCAAVPGLMPAALALLRAKNREVVKAALGFVKVAAVRLPMPQLLPHVPDMVGGLTLWDGDTKNRFRAKVRAVLERLVRRCGADAVAAHVPAEHAALVAHIRKEHTREERRKHASAAGSQPGGAGAWTEASRGTRGGRSAWEGSQGAPSRGALTGRTGVTARSAGRVAARQPLAMRLGAAGGASGSRRGGGGAEPLDLLDDSAMRSMLHAERGASGGGRGPFDDLEDEGGAGYGRSADGRLMVVEERGGGKRGRPDEGDDGDDARSAGGRSAGGRSGVSSRGGRSVGGKQVVKRVRTGGMTHTAAAFRPAKKGTGGDASRGGVQPYAYWPMDAKLLNRRAGRRREATQGLDKVVSAVRAARKGKAKQRQ
jgi:ribosomal RNA-processing protein 12